MSILSHFSLENFRLFKQKTSFELAPITILTGTNSSGKSSLIKAILLLKNNFEKNKSIEEIDFSIGDHNLNDFKNSLNYDSESNKMFFTFSIEVEALGSHIIELGYKLDYTENSKGNLNSLIIYSLKGEVILSSTKQLGDDFFGPYIEYKIDFKYFLDNFKYSMLTHFHEFKISADQSIFDFSHETSGEIVLNDIIEKLKKEGVDEQTGITENEMKYYNQSIENGISMLGHIIFYRIERELEGYNISIKKTDFGKLMHDQFSKKVFPATVKNIINCFDSINHFASIRSESKKYYTDSQNASLSFFLDYFYQSPKFNAEINEFMKQQLGRFSLGEKIEIDNHKNLVAEVFVIRESRRVLLSDLGFGFTQLLPVIMKIALAANKNLADIDEIMAGAYEGEQPYYHSQFLLEEPESNLHPSFQTKIADLIFEANKKFNIRFVVETHSEYLIRKLQYLTAKNKLTVDDTSILYFHQKGTKDYLTSPYRTIRILGNGRLSMPFGEGFFDEADKIAFELYRLTLINN